jgi:PST family polysaccharide transporter
MQGVNLVAGIVLARLLSPEDFGVYGILSFLVVALAFLGDVGLGAALIQRPTLTEDDLSTTFTIQIGLTVFVVVLLLLFAPLIRWVYPSLPEAAITMIRCLALALFFSSLRTLPAITLERHLEFEKLAVVEIVETVVFQTTAVVLALMGFGVWSFIVAILLRGVMGVIVLYVISPYRPKFKVKRAVTFQLLRFGLGFQLNGLLNRLKDSEIFLFAGIYQGASSVGYLNWAWKYSSVALAWDESVSRVTFPLFSRLQEDKDHLRRTLNRAMQTVAIVIWPIQCLLISTASSFIPLVFTDKWMPALRPFQCVSFSVIGASLVRTAYNVLFALGRNRIAIRSTVLYTVLNWVFFVALFIKFGLIGAGVANVITTYLFLIFFFYAGRKVVRFDVTPLLPIFFSSVVGAVVAGVLTHAFVRNVVTLGLAECAGLVGYLLTLLILMRQTLTDFKEVLVDHKKKLW